MLHLGAERVFGALGLKVLGIPFKGAAETAREFLGGHITFYAGGSASILAQAKAGKAKCLLLTSAANNPQFPQATGLSALGVGDMEAVFWRAIIVPRGTPAEMIEKLERSFSKAAQHPRFLEISLRTRRAAGQRAGAGPCWQERPSRYAPRLATTCSCTARWLTLAKTMSSWSLQVVSRGPSGATSQHCTHDVSS